jgi:hypothetical protein
MRDVVPFLANDKDSLTSRELQEFTIRRINVAVSGKTDWLAGVLLSDSSRQCLIADFVGDATGSSIQSVDGVQKVATILGIPERHDLRKVISTLRPSFEARNRIVHELDLQVPLGPGTRKKRNRTLSASIPLAHALLDVPQQIINFVGDQIAGRDSESG